MSLMIYFSKCFCVEKEFFLITWAVYKT